MSSVSVCVKYIHRGWQRDCAAKICMPTSIHLLLMILRDNEHNAQHGGRGVTMSTVCSNGPPMVLCRESGS
jgi:hypothetical protein